MKGKIMTDRPEFPVKDQETRKMLVMDNLCPECGDELDTGFECNNYNCQFDALPEIEKNCWIM